MRSLSGKKTERKTSGGPGIKAALVLAAALLVSLVQPVTGAAAEQPRVFSPQAAAAGPENSLLVSDCYSKVIWMVTEESRTVYAGKPGPEGLYGEPLGGYEDGGRLEMRMDSPWDIVPYQEGFAVSDKGNNVIRYIGPEGAKTLAGRGKKGDLDGLGGRALFSGPAGLAADGGGNLYIADTDNDVIRILTPDGRVDTWLRGLSGPTGLCWHDGALYVADTGNHRVLKAVDGQIEWSAGGEEGEQDGGILQARFSSPGYVAAGADGTIYVSDPGNGAVRRIRDGQVSTVAWDESRYPGMELVSPSGLIATDRDLYVCDPFSRRIFRLSL